MCPRTEYETGLLFEFISQRGPCRAYRHAWCCLRDAGERAGMRRVLEKRPWGNAGDALEGGKEAVGSDVLKVRA